MDLLLTPHFNTREFYHTDRFAFKKAQKDAYFSEPRFLINSMYIALFLENARAFVHQPIRINSAFRLASLNSLVGGVMRSRHLSCLAVDISCSDLDILKRFFERLDGISCSDLAEVVFHKTYIHLGFYNPSIPHGPKRLKIKYAK